MKRVTCPALCCVDAAYQGPRGPAQLREPTPIVAVVQQPGEVRFGFRRSVKPDNWLAVHASERTCRVTKEEAAALFAELDCE